MTKISNRLKLALSSYFLASITLFLISFIGKIIEDKSIQFLKFSLDKFLNIWFYKLFILLISFLVGFIIYSLFRLIFNLLRKKDAKENIKIIINKIFSSNSIIFFPVFGIFSYVLGVILYYARAPEALIYILFPAILPSSSGFAITGYFLRGLINISLIYLAVALLVYFFYKKTHGLIFLEKTSKIVFFSLFILSLIFVFAIKPLIKKPVLQVLQEPSHIQQFTTLSQLMPDRKPDTFSNEALNVDFAYFDKFHNKLWVKTPNDILIYDGAKWERYADIYKPIPENIFNKLSQILIDKNNNVYFLTTEGDLFALKNTGEIVKISIDFEKKDYSNGYPINYKKIENFLNDKQKKSGGIGSINSDGEDIFVSFYSQTDLTSEFSYVYNVCLIKQNELNFCQDFKFQNFPLDSFHNKFIIQDIIDTSRNLMGMDINNIYKKWGEILDINEKNQKDNMFALGIIGMDIDNKNEIYSATEKELYKDSDYKGNQKILDETGFRNLLNLSNLEYFNISSLNVYEDVLVLGIKIENKRGVLQRAIILKYDTNKDSWHSFISYSPERMGAEGTKDEGIEDINTIYLVIDSNKDVWTYNTFFKDFKKPGLIKVTF